MKVIVLPDSSSNPDQILGFLDSAATTTTTIHKPLLQTQPEICHLGWYYTSTGTAITPGPATSW